MPKPTKGPRLGGGPAHERLLLANLAAALFTHKSIQTTQTKAKRLQPLAERLITFAKRGDLHARRRVMGIISDKGVVHELFTEIAPQVADREGGYTRITKTGYRKGDNAPMAVIELVLEPVTPKVSSTRRSSATIAAAAPSASTDESPSEEIVDETADATAPDETVTAEEASVDESIGGADEEGAEQSGVPVEETEAVETSEPTPAEVPDAAAAEVEVDAAEKSADVK